MKKLFLVLGLALGLTISTTSAPQEKTKPEKTAAASMATDDSTLVKNVKEKLASTPSLKDNPITVEAKNGMVTLTGEVKNPGTKGAATRIVRKIAGVKGVDNQLTVASAAGKAKTAKK